MSEEQKLYDRVVEINRQTFELIEDTMRLKPTVELCIFAGKLGSVVDILANTVDAGVPVPDPGERPHPLHPVELAEEERQMVLMALAHLSVERPGWDDALSRLARRMDGVVPENSERPIMYDEFRRLHRSRLGSLVEGHRSEPGDAASAEMEAVADDDDG